MPSANRPLSKVICYIAINLRLAGFTFLLEAGSFCEDDNGWIICYGGRVQVGDHEERLISANQSVLLNPLVRTRTNSALALDQDSETDATEDTAEASTDSRYTINSD